MRCKETTTSFEHRVCQRANDSNAVKKPRCPSADQRLGAYESAKVARRGVFFCQFDRSSWITAEFLHWFYAGDRPANVFAQQRFSPCRRAHGSARALLHRREAA